MNNYQVVVTSKTGKQVIGGFTLAEAEAVVRALAVVLPGHACKITRPAIFHGEPAESKGQAQPPGKPAS